MYNQNNKKNSNGKGKSREPVKGPSAVSWPKEYAEVSTHPVQHALGRSYTYGNIKGVFKKAIRISVANLIPTDKDHEYYDSVTNQYKILKSLTSGARFYNQNTLYALKVGYRRAVIDLARAYGLINAITATLQVENAPHHAAWNLMDVSTVTYTAALNDLSRYRDKLAEAVSELNSIPMPNEGGLEEFFEYYSHIYRDDHGKSSDYYMLLPRNADDVAYIDTVTGSGGTPGYMSAVQHHQIFNATIDALLDDVVGTCGRLRASLDINNCMSDLIGQFPSSRYDWGAVLARHKDFERPMSGKLASALSSAPLLCATEVAFGELSTAGDNIEVQQKTFNAPIANWASHVDDDQWLDTRQGAEEISSYAFAMVSEGTGQTDRLDTTGFALTFVDIVTTIGTSTSKAPGVSVQNLFAKTNSTVQSDAEEGGKRLAIAWIQFKALPKIDMSGYGATGSIDDLFWNPEDIRLVAAEDIRINIRAINMVRNAMTHLTTERKR